MGVQHINIDKQCFLSFLFYDLWSKWAAMGPKILTGDRIRGSQENWPEVRQMSNIFSQVEDDLNGGFSPN